MIKNCFPLYLFLLLISFFITTDINAGDWPMWRYDAERSAGSPEEISGNPKVLWMRRLPAPRQAWLNVRNNRLDFDASYEPVVMGKILFLASQNDASLTAFDTDTGKEKWKFFTEGPIRCAPVCWKGKVYAGSDDGYLYSLNASDGKLLWKFRGAPEERPDHRHLGNNHLVSFWPVRGGPVIKNGTIYSAAGIWPSLGVFVFALDAETGAIKWRQSNLNLIKDVKLDHEKIYDAGLSPQGHLLLSDEKLIIPNGRSMPAGLNASNGEIIYFIQGYRNGDSKVAVNGNYAFVGKKGVVNLSDFREVGSKWAKYGKNGPPGHWRRGFANYESPYMPYKFAEACDSSSAFENGRAYGVKNGTVYAYDIARAKRPQHKRKFYGKFDKILTWKPHELWELKTKNLNKPSDVIIKAGSRLYANSGNKLFAVKNLKKEPEIAWEMELDGIPSSIIAADGKLFVATKEGMLYCLGSGEKGKVYDGKLETLLARNDKWTTKAANLLKETGSKSGYCLVLGIENGRLVEELLKQSKLTILAVDENSSEIDKLRSYFSKNGLLGSKIELFVGKPLDFKFPPYIANLVVSENQVPVALINDATINALFKCLRPYGGTLSLELDSETTDSFLKAGRGENFVLNLSGKNLTLVSKGALPGTAPWTHEAASAAHTYFSPDKLVKAPLAFLWYGDDNAFSQHNDYGQGAKPQVVEGRVFAIQQKSKTLFAYDAYTGRFLWRIPTHNFFARTASMPDGVYLATGSKCRILDPATGTDLKTFTFKYDGKDKPYVKDIRVGNGVILIAYSEKREKNINKGYWDCSTIVCLDRETGKELWRRNAKERFNRDAIALGEGIVFCVDSVSITTSDRWNKRRKEIKKSEPVLYALDAKTGETLWTRKTSYPPVTSPHGFKYVESKDEWVGYSSDHKLVLWGRMLAGGAYEAKTGKPLWESKEIGEAPIIIRHNTFINQGMRDWNLRQCGYVFNIMTGKLMGPDPIIDTRTASCNYAVAGEELLFVRNRFVEYAKIDSNEEYFVRGIRSGCSASLVPADGLLNVPNFSNKCICNYPIITSFAMFHMPDAEKWAGDEPVAMNVPEGVPGKGRFLLLGPVFDKLVDLEKMKVDIGSGKLANRKWLMTDLTTREWSKNDPDDDKWKDLPLIDMPLHGSSTDIYFLMSDIVSQKEQVVELSPASETGLGIFVNGNDFSEKKQIALKKGVNRFVILSKALETVHVELLKPGSDELAKLELKIPLIADSKEAYTPPRGEIGKRVGLSGNWKGKIIHPLAPAKALDSVYPDKGISSEAKKTVAASFDDNSWQDVDIPTEFEKFGGKWDNIDGEVVFRRTIDIPEEWVGKDIMLSLGAIDDFDDTYWNGKLVGRTDASNPKAYSHQRKYMIPGKLVKASGNVIAVRVFDRFGGGGITGPPKNLYISKWK